eukprot:12730290-Prorocentrum_lima.AAC.1
MLCFRETCVPHMLVQKYQLNGVVHGFWRMVARCDKGSTNNNPSMLVPHVAAQRQEVDVRHRR